MLASLDLAARTGTRIFSQNLLRGGLNRYKGSFIKDIYQILNSTSKGSNVWDRLITGNISSKGSNAWDKIIKQGGFRRAIQRAKENNITPWRLARRLMNRGLWKYAFSTLPSSGICSLRGLGWDYWKQQFKAAGYQASLTGVFTKFPNPHKMLEDILKKLIMKSDESKASDSSPLSSLVVIWGRWTPTISNNKEYWIGTLELTYSPYIDNVRCIGKRRKPKTYVHNNVPLATWILMKAAMGMCGTGAYTIFKRTYHNFLGGPIPPFWVVRASNQTFKLKFLNYTYLRSM